jgi:hypothetical protein
MERILGPAPALPVALATPIGMPAPVPPAGAPHGAPPKSLGERAFERRLAGPAFAKVSNEPCTRCGLQIRLPRRLEIRDT